MCVMCILDTKMCFYDFYSVGNLPQQLQTGMSIPNGNTSFESAQI